MVVFKVLMNLLEYFRPTSHEIAGKWLEIIKQHQNCNSSKSLCHLHFEKKYLFRQKNRVKLKDDAIPTIFLSPEPSKSYVLILKLLAYPNKDGCFILNNLVMKKTIPLQICNRFPWTPNFRSSLVMVPLIQIECKVIFFIN